MAEHHEGTSDGHEHREAPGLGDAAGSPSARTPAPARDAGPRPGGPRRWVPWAIGAAVVVLALVVAFGPGLLATRVVAPRLARTLGVPVAIGWLWWNPFTGWWTVTALQVGATAGEPALAARPLAARVYLWDVLRGRRRVRGLQVGRAAVRATPTATGWSLPLPPAEAGGGRFFFTVEHADVRQTTIRLEPAGAAPVRVRVRRLDVSTLGVEPPATWASGWLHASVAGRALRAAVSYRATDARARARARLLTHRLDLAHLAALVPSPDRRVAGHLTLEGTYAGATREGRVRRLVAGRLALRDAAVGAAGAQGLTARAVTLSRSRVGLVRRKAALGRLRVREAEAWLEGAAGALRIPGVWEPGGGAGPAWHLTARGASLDGGRLHYEAAGRPPLVVRVPRATVGRAPAGAAPVPVSLVLEPESGGRVSVNGRVVREPLAVDADVAADGLELAPLAAWAGTRLELASGRADAALHVASEGGGLAASGDVTVDDLKSVAPADAPEDVLACHRAVLHLRRATWAPPAVDLASVEVSSPYVFVHRTARGMFPLSLASPAVEPPVPAPPPPVAVHADRIELAEGRLDFLDSTLPQPYWRSLARLALTADDVSLPPARAARFRGTGMVDEISPVKIRGTLGEQTHVTADVGQLSLEPFNPYLVPVSAYEVSSGALTMHSEITLDRSQLETTNRLVLSRLGLTGGSESDFLAQQLGIPLTLALALMKDYRGNIDLTLPIAGDLSSPSFSLSSLVLQAVVRAIRGAILSPLNALGRLVLGEGGRILRIELEPIPFPAAAAALSPAGEQRVVEVGRVLRQHPDIGLTVTGRVAAADVDALGERGQPWPLDALQALARSRGETAAAALAGRPGVAAKQVRTAPPPAPAPDTLVPVPSATLGLGQ